MRVTKLGHCCLLIETKGKRILTDPGSYTVKEHSNLEYIDFILYTHEHADHYHLDSLKSLLRKNPEVKIYSNSSVGELLNKEGIKHTTLKNGELVFLGEVSLTGIGKDHAIMHSSIPVSENMGFFIDEQLWYPRDSFTNPERAVEILALPVSGPWMKIGEAIDYALLLKPKTAFPVHDGTRWESSHVFPEKILKENGIDFIVLKEGQFAEF